jgi:hypothetical protein
MKYILQPATHIYFGAMSSNFQKLPTEEARASPFSVPVCVSKQRCAGQKSCCATNCLCCVFQTNLFNFAPENVKRVKRPSWQQISKQVIPYSLPKLTFHLAKSSIWLLSSSFGKSAKSSGSTGP